MKGYHKNPGELPVLKLCNKFEPNCPKTDITPLGPLGGKHNKDVTLIKHMQSMLIALGYDLGANGVDGDFGELTKNAVIDFQRETTDWEGTKLNEDGLVGPKTADALNRAMVGKWYEHYQTPEEIINGKLYFTVTSKFLTDEGLSIEPEKVKEARLILVGSVASKAGIMLDLKFKIDPDYVDSYDDTVRLFSDDGTYEKLLAVRENKENEKGISTLHFKGIIPEKNYSAEVDQGKYEYGEPGGRYYLFKNFQIIMDEKTKVTVIETIYPSFKFKEDGRPAKWVFIYLGLPRTENFKLDFAFVTDGNGRLGTLEAPERSAILKVDDKYNLFYDFRPLSEEELGALTAEDCQEIIINDEILLESKSGDIEVEFQDADGKALQNHLYRLHLPDGSIWDGITDDKGILKKNDVPVGIVRLEMFTAKKPVKESGEEFRYEIYEIPPGGGAAVLGLDDQKEQELEALGDEELDAIDEFEKNWGDIQKSLEEDSSSLPALTEDVTLVEIGWLQSAIAILSRGRKYTIRVIANWSRPWKFDFRHWTLMQIVDVKEESDKALKMQSMSWKQIKNKGVK